MEPQFLFGCGGIQLVDFQECVGFPRLALLKIIYTKKIKDHNNQAFFTVDESRKSSFHTFSIQKILQFEE